MHFPRRKQNNLEPLSPALQETLKACEKELESLKQALKTLKWHKQTDSISALPIFLVTGPTLSGKTSLIKHTMVDWLQQTQSNQALCHYWVSHHAIFLEVPDISNDLSESKRFWSELIAQMHKYGLKNSIRGILLTFDLNIFLHQDYGQQKSLAGTWHSTIDFLQSKIPAPLQTHIIFTHLDSLAGAAAFMSELTSEQSSEPFGFSLENVQDKLDFSHQFSDNFQHLLKNIHQKLLPILHHAHQDLSDTLMQDFPIQLDCLQISIQQFCERIFYAESTGLQTHLNAVFFVANTCQGIQFDTVAHSVYQTLQMKAPKPKKQKHREQAFFSAQLIKQVCPSSLAQHSSNPKKHKFQYYLICTAAVCICAFSLGGGILTLKHHMSVLKDTEKALTDYDLNDSRKLSDLNSLALVQDKLHNLSTPKMLFFPHLSRLKNAYGQFYQHAISHDFLKQSSRDIENRLLETKLSPEKRYNLLKTYLMLASPKRRNPQFMRVELDYFWRNQHFSEQDIKARLRYLDSAIEGKLPSKQLNVLLVNKVREQLNQLPLPFLAYTILKSRSEKLQDKHSQPIALNLLSTEKHNIPYLFTKHGYITLQTTLDEILNNLNDGDWVLNKAYLNQIPYNELKEQVSTLYLTDYVNWWNLFIYNARPIMFKSLDEGHDYLKKFSDPINGFSTLVTILKNNTSPIETLSPSSIAFNKAVVSKFKPLQKIFDNRIELIETQLRSVTTLLSEVNSAVDHQQFAFDILKKQYMNPNLPNPVITLFEKAKPLPSPVKEWVQAVAVNSWYLILENAQAHINQVWQKLVYPNYAIDIENRYPFNEEANQSISLTAFKQFFGPNQILDQFFKTYLKPFMDTTHPDWTLKKVLGFQLNVPKETIEQFERAGIIQSMFFPKSAQDMHFEFSIKLNKLTPTIKDVIVNIHGNKIYDYAGSKKASQFDWPANSLEDSASISITDENNQLYSLSETGPWAIFKLLKQLHLHKQSDLKHYLGEMQHDNLHLQYVIIANETINPLIPGILDHFALPNELTETK